MSSKQTKQQLPLMRELLLFFFASDGRIAILQHMNAIARTYKKVYDYFDKFEDRVRAWLSRSPILYAFIAGVSIVLFWRGVWRIGDWLEGRGGFLGVLFSGPGSVLLTVVVMLATGLFISFFVGDLIIMSGLKREKKIVDKTELEVKDEETKLEEMEEVLSEVQEELRHLHREHTKMLSEDVDTEAR